MDQPLLPRSHRRDISRHAPAGNRIASRPRILAHRRRPRLSARSRHHAELTDIEATELKFLSLFENEKPTPPNARSLSPALPPSRRRHRRRKICPPRPSRSPRSHSAPQNAHAENRSVDARDTDERPMRSARMRGRKNPRGSHRHARPASARYPARKSAVTRAVIRRLENRRHVCSPGKNRSPPRKIPGTPISLRPQTSSIAEQKHALAEIWRWLVAEKFTAALLHGVTGSGKTEVYLGAIEAALSRGKSRHRPSPRNRAHPLGRPPGPRALRR